MKVCSASVVDTQRASPSETPRGISPRRSPSLVSVMNRDHSGSASEGSLPKTRRNCSRTGLPNLRPEPERVRLALPELRRAVRHRSLVLRVAAEDLTTAEIAPRTRHRDGP